MKITQIKQQVKRKDRYSICVDGKYSFSLSEAEFVKSDLKQGKTLTEAELSKLKVQAELDKAYDRTLRFIGIRPRSRWEIEQYLKRKGCDKDLTKTALAKIEELGLVNDEAFAKQWVEWRTSSGGRSKQRLRAELYQKKVAPEIIDGVISSIDSENELTQLKALVERKKRYSQYQDKQKLMAYLARQGYSYSLIKRVFEELE